MTADSLLLTALQTKFYAPGLTADIVTRERLLELMNRATEVPLTLVSAPAGYGKSVLVSQWAKSQNIATCWLSLDDQDSDLRQFLIHFVGSVDKTFPGSCQRTLELVNTPEERSLAEISSQLANDLVEIFEPLVIMFDDFHLIEQSSPVHQLLDLLLRHPLANLHIVLITRRDPSLPLHLMRARNKVLDIRMADLRFSKSEAAALLVKVLDYEASDDALLHLQQEFEGWAAGFRLVSLALRNNKQPDEFLKGLKGGLPQIQEYLFHEVLAGLTPWMRNYLLKTSILDRFCDNLIEFVCSQETEIPEEPENIVGIFLDQLQDLNLFTFSLDDQANWFRYHHLFQQMLQIHLRHEYSKEEIERLHLRASIWYDDKGLVFDAIKHAQAAGKPDKAVKIVERNRMDKLEEDQWYIIKQWLDLLPSDARLKSPVLMLTDAWIAYFRLDLDTLDSVVRRVGSLLADHEPVPSLLAEYYHFQSVLHYWQGEGKTSKRFARKALKLFSGRREAIYGEFWLYVVIATQMEDGFQSALEFIETNTSPDTTSPFFLTRQYAGRCFIQLLAGMIKPVISDGEHLENVANQGQSELARAWSHYLRGLARLHSLQLDAALENFDKARQKQKFYERTAAVDNLACIALTSQLMSRDRDALDAAEALRDFARQMDEPHYTEVAKSCRARIALLQKDTPAALEWAMFAMSEVDVPSVFIWLESPAVTRARILVAVGGETSLREASEFLAGLQAQLEHHHNDGQVIEVMALRALVLEKQGQHDQSLDMLRGALELAAPRNWIRTFIEPGLPMANLLRRLPARYEHREFVDRLLAAFPVTEQPAGSRPGDAVHWPAPGVRVIGDRLTALTNREIDIIELLAQRMQNKEIANRLFISTNTVKDHLKHIYQKLGVSNRRQAVGKAIETGEFSPK